MEANVAVYVFGSPIDAQQYVNSGAAGVTWGREIPFKSKIRSPGCYVNCRVLPAHPEVWGALLNKLINYAINLKTDLKFDTIASVETGATPHGAVIAWEMGIPHVSVKKTEKQHGISGLVAGDPGVVEGKRILLMEDMGTTGRSSLEAIAPLEAMGGKVVCALLLATYSFPDLERTSRELGIDFHAQCSFGQILEILIQEGRIGGAHLNLVRSWLRDPWKEWQWPVSAK